MPTQAAPRDWYRISLQADPAVAEIWIYDVIGEDYWTGEGVTAKKFLDELKTLPETVTTLRVHVNSPGGSVFDAVAIANMLRAQSTEQGRTVEMLIEALAASAASVITSAGDSIKIASNAMMMVHNPSAIVWGQAKDMREMAAALDSIRDAIVATYRWVSQLSAEAIQTLMDATTWMSAEEALANGFVTEIMEPVKVTACFPPEALAKLGEIPDPYRARLATLTIPAPDALAGPKPEPVPDPVDPVAPAPADATAILAACRTANCLDLAEELVAERATPEQVAARLAAAQEIRGLCAMAKLPELAGGYLRARMAPADVKAHLTTITAKMDAVEIVTALPVDGGTAPRAKSGINPVSAMELYTKAATTAR